MRPPSSPDAKRERPRDPSYPDRARIDSDVREFMRQPSTPWIVFDRDSRVDRSEIGAILPAAKSSILPDYGVFPPSLETAPTEPVIEPSNCVVATDVIDNSTPSSTCAVSTEIVPPPPELLPPPVPQSPRFMLIGGAIVGAIGLIAVIAFVLGGRARSEAKPTTAAAHATVPAEPSPPNLDLPPAAASEPAPATTTAPAPPEPASEKPAPASTNAPDLSSTDPKKKFGRLTIKGAATGRQVFLDGKRLLGTGQRTFTVFCGEHTIAINDRAEARDVVIPCNGELAITR